MAANRWWMSGNYSISYREAQRLINTRFEWTLLNLALTGVFIWPLLLNIENSSFLFINETLILILALIGFNIITGFAGLVNLGHAAIVAVGAYSFYTVMTLASNLNMPLENYWVVVLLISGLSGSLISALVGLPSLRLKNLYLGMATLGFQIILDWGLRTQEFFQYGNGLGVERMSLFGHTIDRQRHNLFWYYVILSILMISFITVRNLLRTGSGRQLIAIRDNERAIESIGISSGLTKVYAFALGGFFAGLAGGLQAIVFRTIEADAFTWASSVKYISMAVIGGLGSLKGCVFGAVLIQSIEVFMPELVSFLAAILNYNEAVLTASLRPMLFGTTTLLFLYFQPKGLAYAWHQIKVRIMIWPRNP